MTLSSPTRVAVVGVGALGEHHARIYANLPQANLVAVGDIRSERAERIAHLYGCRACHDYREILDEVEAVSLAVPTRDHASIGTILLKRGIHVLVEKPIAETLSQADQLIEAEQQGGSLLQVGFSERFNPALHAVLPHLTQPRFFEAHRLGIFVPRSLDIDVVLDLMIHDLDLIRHLTPSPVGEIRAVGIPVLTPEVDIANARLEFENGCVANLTASRVSTEKLRKLRLFQPHDYVSIDFQEQTAHMLSLDPAGGRRQIAGRPLSVQRDEPLRLEIQTFLEAVQNSPSRFSGCAAVEARASLDLALQVIQCMSK